LKPSPGVFSSASTTNTRAIGHGDAGQPRPRRRPAAAGGSPLETSSGVDGGTTTPVVAKEEEKKREEGRSAAGQRAYGEGVIAPPVRRGEEGKAAPATARPLPHEQVPQPADVYNPQLERL
ncbi:Os12g0530300, partial [Oryza sativa Japonica Group]